MKRDSAGFPSHCSCGKRVKLGDQDGFYRVVGKVRVTLCAECRAKERGT